MPPATTSAPAAQQLEDAGDRRDGGGVDLGAQPAGPGELVEVAEEAEAGDVGQGVGAGAGGRPARRRG